MIHRIKKYSVFIVSVGLIFSCTKLDEKLNDSKVFTSASVNPKDLLTTIYTNNLGTFEHERKPWGLQEHTTDECVGPTRGGDWDDNGVFRELHTHTWRLDHAYITATFNDLGKIVYNATEVTGASTATKDQIAQARFLRAFAMFYILEGWNQVPIREAGGDPLAYPKVMVGETALNFIIAETEKALTDLTEGSATTAPIPSKNAARVLLMKCYLMKGVIKNRTNPTFDNADMQKVLDYGNAIKNSSAGYTLTANYFDNFAPKNDQLSTENIFTIENKLGTGDQNLISNRWYCTLHYNQNYGPRSTGWNGFATLSDFYNKFEAADVRRSSAYEPMTTNTGTKAGFLIGDQKTPNGTFKTDRGNNNLSYTSDVKLIETGNNLEVTGIRVLKYIPDILADVAGNNNKAENDYVIYRYADVLLMIAEAKLRMGQSGDAEVNEVRTRAKVGNLTGVTLEQLYDERGRELYWEGFRRMDMLRWKKYLDKKQLKPFVSNAHLVLFPLSEQQLAANPNLVQNPGY